MESGSESDFGKWKYDLFVSFAFKDVRHTFLERLKDALDETRSCRIYWAETNLNRADNIALSLRKAIEESRMSIIAFSTRYAESAWCLDELVHILKCRETGDHKVFPIFYDVDTDDVHELTASYAVAFDKHEERHDKGKVDVWRGAVQKAACIAGIDSNRWSEKEFMAKIVAQVVAIVKSKPLVIEQPLVELPGFQKVYNSLEMGINDARMIVIWGDEALGKTTIAKFIYNKILPDFNYFCFLHNVGIRHKSQQDSNRALMTLQNEILSALLETRSRCSSVGEGKGLIMNSCLTKKVLFVIDGVDDWAQIKALGLHHYWTFGKESRIIVTTRHRELFGKLVVSEDNPSFYYQAARWKPNESLQLFCLHAFGKAEPDSPYNYLTNYFVKFSKGCPVFLKNLGSHLNGKNNKEWNRFMEETRKFMDGKLREVGIRDSEDDNGQRSKYKRQNMVIGLWGGEDGKEWTYQPKGEICKIRITFDQNAIHGIGFTNKGENGGEEIWMHFGGIDSKKVDKAQLILQSDDKELIIGKLNGIRGTVDTYNGMQIVTSLRFTSNDNKTFGPYGEERGASFKMKWDAHRTIIGFHGRSSRWLNAIGVILDTSPESTSV